MLPQLYKCFQHWSAGGSVYIYSDPHFEDSDCKTIDATWPAPAEQIAKINAKVHKGDTLIILGDIGNLEWIKQIKAHYKILIAGNHDVGLSNYEDYFDEIYGGPLFIGEKILLSHEPIDIPFALNIHGHTHARVGYGFYDLNHFNVCSNTVGFEPQNLSEIIKAGFLKRVETIHRLTIDKASENPIHGRSKTAPGEV